MNRKIERHGEYIKNRKFEVESARDGEEKESMVARSELSYYEQG
jgi:hypothetical protein